MLFVLNKEKILSYIVAFSTVAVLISISMFSTKNNEIETSSTLTQKNNAVHINNIINME